MAEAVGKAFDAAVAEIGAVFEHYLDRLRTLAAEVVAADDAGSLPEAALQPVRHRIEEWLTEDGVCVGYGFVAAPGVVDDLERFMMWFQQQGSGVRRLQLNFDPADIDVYDYLGMEWFTFARDRGGPVCYGPYVDYSGSDLYVMTLTVPVQHGDRFLGVAGADLLAARMESLVIPVLQRVPAETVVVDSERHVVFSNTARWIPGDRLAKHPLEDPGRFRRVAEPVPGVRWAVLSEPVDAD